MITKTIGVGGDYADIGTAWVALPAILFDGYTFNVISDFTEFTGINGNADVKDINGFSVTFQDTGNHQITSAGYVYWITADTTPFLNNSTINIIGLTITLTGYIYTYNHAGLIDISGYNGGDVITVNLVNLKLTGFYKNINSNCGIMLYALSQIDRVTNCTITNFGQGIHCGYIFNTDGTDHIIENCSIYDCSMGIWMQVGSTVLRNYTLKNVVVWGCGIDCYNNNNPADIVDNKLIKCADSDGTMATFGATTTDCITGITAADFKSVDPNSPDFLKISTASHLYAVGNSVGLLPNNTESIEGYPRPNAFGAVSIGVSEPNVEIDFTASPLDPAISETVSFQSTINEAVIPTYSWNLDDGKASAEVNPIAQYAVPGLKTISLTVHDSSGRTATVTKPDYIDVQNNGLGFTAVPMTGRAPLKVQFESSFKVTP